MQALITGANRGLGLEFVHQLAARGDRVFATCRRPEKATALHELGAQYREQITITALDVSDPASISRSQAGIRQQTDRLDLLINNAAVAPGERSLSQVDTHNMQTALAINTIGPMLVVQAYLGLLRAAEGPKIINLSSGLGSLANRESLGPYNYCASKAALNMYTRNLAQELKAEGIMAIALGPGWVQTDMGGPQADITPQVSASTRTNR